ncbi:exodeoxyribonuclease III [Aquabacterium sp. OR-4]|uniref:exodeoxyribonuclease III n=1 Tax=Aquabacterium sp. OR-4 TaxID=2978127 RepID=UPI0028C85888|nr:exodeoxyribonuclease III [Aquabacterium sp. OR-4]MDT7833944.1 exodeoxyribonuclease III [Aquabacterium sp. OR-4]
MAFRLVTLNLNGIRSAANKGFLEWAAQSNADCMGVQEVKAQHEDVAGRFDTVAGMPGHFHYAEKKGYSGVGLYTRHAPSDVQVGLGNPEFDAEGRWVELRFDKPGRKLSIISCYFPSGSSGEDRQQAKFRFLEIMAPHLARLKKTREFILVGDVNIAHQEADLKNWKSNQKNSGFLPEERGWMSTLLGAAKGHGGLVDVYRRLHPDTTDACYTWWSNRGQAYAKNVGWRLDYHLATPALAEQAQAAAIYKDQKFSDHAPLTIDYGFSL